MPSSSPTLSSMGRGGGVGAGVALALQLTDRHSARAVNTSAWCWIREGEVCWHKHSVYSRTCKDDPTGHGTYKKGEGKTDRRRGGKTT